MQVSPLSVAIAGPNRAPPPLPKAGHGHVVQRHLGVDPNQNPAVFLEPQTQLNVLAHQNRRVEAAGLTKCIDADHDVAVRAIDLADGHVPLQVGQAVVARLLRMALAPSTRHQPDFRPLLEHAHPLLEPSVDHFAVAVDELHIRMSGSI